MPTMFGCFGKESCCKPVKIRSLRETKKYGVAAKNLKELIKKSCKLLQAPRGSHRVCLYEDGTEVTEEYFHVLPDHVELVLLSDSETWGGSVCGLSQLLSPDRHAERLVQEAKKLLTDESAPKTRKLLGEIIRNLQDNSDLETREDDEGWFKGVNDRFKSKSAYMKYNCESRMRSYLREVNDTAKTIKKKKEQEEFQAAAELLSDKLKKDKYNGCYFDRTEEEPDRLCTQAGWFTCQGAFDQDACTSFHSINPYGNHESRVVFSTWNLDHMIEKKRAIIPDLLEALSNHKCSDINVDYFYSLLFTRVNLRLVHIVCHKKGQHNLNCDKKKIYKRAIAAEKTVKNGKRLRRK